jgi:hypothetical protein
MYLLNSHYYSNGKALISAYLQNLVKNHAFLHDITFLNWHSQNILNMNYPDLFSENIRKKSYKIQF